MAAFFRKKQSIDIIISLSLFPKHLEKLFRSAMALGIVGYIAIGVLGKPQKKSKCLVAVSLLAICCVDAWVDLNVSPRAHRRRSDGIRGGTDQCPS